MDKEKIQQTVIKANCALELGRRIVGVKFLFSEEEFLQAAAKLITAPMHYCAMVKAATAGHSVKAAAGNFGCQGGARALGIMEPEEAFVSGRHYHRLGLYQDLGIAKNARNNMTLCQHKAYGVMVKPLQEFTEQPEVVLIIANSYNAMRIVQGYTYAYGIHTSFKLSGNQAVCSECTAYPFESNNINISMLCGGTRNRAGWNDSDLGIGMPFNRFSAVIDGVYKTVNAMEPNRNKAKIEAKLKQNKLDDLVIEYNKNYFTRPSKK